MKYRGESRHIGLETQPAKSRYGTEEIRITVQDHWLGIKPDELPEILEPFRRGREVIEVNIAGRRTGIEPPIKRSEIEVYEEAHLVD